jgi:hypothetical protein
MTSQAKCAIHFSTGSGTLPWSDLMFRLSTPLSWYPSFSLARKAVISIPATLIGLLVGCVYHDSRLVTVAMKLEQNTINTAGKTSLHFENRSLDCWLSFSQPSEFRGYLANFGSGSVPVVFRVTFDGSGKPLDAVLISVGAWNAQKLPSDERHLTVAREFRHLKPGETYTTSLPAPGDCFDPIVRKP